MTSHGMGAIVVRVRSAPRGHAWLLSLAAGIGARAASKVRQVGQSERWRSRQDSQFEAAAYI